MKDQNKEYSKPLHPKHPDSTFKSVKEYNKAYNEWRKRPAVCVDIGTIGSIKGLPAKQIMDLWVNTKTLIYDGSKGQAPILLDTHDKQLAKLVDISTLPPEELEKVLKTAKATKL
ncbi:hypothetical protein LCGC14_0501070 [marine sediment metagenome]|uniref:Uncharacterized protein n=1 Tax=marine sediment metagenome TaxID=412755 RepID=A0A0F9SMC2_9ZZZZ|nr:hypothetical protein [Pricia sp.]